MKKHYAKPEITVINACLAPFLDDNHFSGGEVDDEEKIPINDEDVPGGGDFIFSAKSSRSLWDLE